MAKKKESDNMKKKLDEQEEIKEQQEETGKMEKGKSKADKKKGFYQWEELFYAFILIIVFLAISKYVGITKTYGIHDDQKGKKSFKIGEVFQSKELRVKLNTVNLNYTNTSSFNPVPEGYKVVQYKFTGENIGESIIQFGFPHFKCFADNQAMDQYTGYRDADPNLGGVVSPGQTAEAHVYCTVPQNASTIYVEYHPVYAESNYKFFAK